MIKLYADENFEFPVVRRIREKGYDLLTTRDAGKDNQSIPDEESKEKQKNLTIALDLEGTLISNAVSQFPRPGLLTFLEYCHQNFVGVASRFDTRLVIFTAVNEVRFRSISRTLDEKAISD